MENRIEMLKVRTDIYNLQDKIIQSKRKMKFLQIIRDSDEALKEADDLLSDVLATVHKKDMRVAYIKSLRVKGCQSKDIANLHFYPLTSQIMDILKEC